MSNPFLLFSLLAAFFTQLAVLYVPALQFVFRTVPLSISEWLHIAVVTSTVIIGVEMDKWIRKKRISIPSNPAPD
jgi:magnesium-transporting ATPase (P-type)